jgi:hypothetical protein
MKSRLLINTYGFINEIKNINLFLIAKIFLTPIISYIFFKSLNIYPGNKLVYLLFSFFSLFYLNSSRILIEEKILIMPIVLTQLISGAGYFNGGFIIAYFIICVSVVQTKINFFEK